MFDLPANPQRSNTPKPLSSLITKSSSTSKRSKPLPTSAMYTAATAKCQKTSQKSYAM
jgi:hypothetical protein